MAEKDYVNAPQRRNEKYTEELECDASGVYLRFTEAVL